MASKTQRPVGDPRKCWGMKKCSERDLSSVRGLKNGLRGSWVLG